MAYVPTFKNILCPVDFSDSSRHALTVATELARSSNAALTLAHIWQPPLPLYVTPVGTPDAAVSGELIQAMVDDAERSLADWEATARAAGVASLQSKMLSGVPWDEIVKLALDSHADLVVMGTHGRTGLTHVLIGSVAEKVVRHAPCAVLVVR